MKFTKLIKAEESIYEKYKKEMDTANSNYDVIGKQLKVMQDKFHEISSKAHDVYYRANAGEDKELAQLAKELYNLIQDASWDEVHNLQEVILKVIYK